MSRQFQYQDWAEPVQPQGDVNPASWTGYHPDKTDRKTFPTSSQQSFFGPIQVVPLISMWMPDYPDQIQRKQNLIANLNMVLPGGNPSPPSTGANNDVIYIGHHAVTGINRGRVSVGG